MWQRIRKFICSEPGMQFLVASGFALFILITSIQDGFWPRNSYKGIFLPLIPLGILFSATVVLRPTWARATGIVFYVALTIAAFWGNQANGFQITDLLWTLLTAFGIYNVWRMEFPGESDATEAEEENSPLVSLVLLLREMPHLEPFIVARLASEAWGIEVTASEPGDDDEDKSQEEESEDDPNAAFVVGAPPIYFIKHPDGMFLMNVFESTYWKSDDMPEVIESITELRTKMAIDQHTAWVSVDLLGHTRYENDQELQKAYRAIGRLLAQVADENTLAVLDPQNGWIRPYDPELEAKLRSDDPQEAFKEFYYSPIITIDGDDPAMKQAVAECRERWPEFVAAFEARPTSGEIPPFMIKAPFSEGANIEFMWVEVTAVENDVIYGKLGNEPANISHLKEGDRVKVNVSDLNDWLFVQNDDPVGGFTMKVLSDRAKGKGK